MGVDRNYTGDTKVGNSKGDVHIVYTRVTVFLLETSNELQTKAIAHTITSQHTDG